MGNTSATGGPLLPMSSPPAPVVLEDEALWTFFQNLFVGICGQIPGNLFFQRWQPEMENLPPVDNPRANWAALGVTTSDITQYEYIGHVAGTDVPLFPAYDVYQAHEDLEIMTSFYGPLSATNAKILRDGIQLGQNREPLFLAGMGLINVGNIVTVPELIKQRWLKRVDFPVRIRRGVVRWYAVDDLAEADVTIHTDVPSGTNGAPLTTTVIVT